MAGVTVELDDKDLTETLRRFEKYQDNRLEDIKRVLVVSAINIERRARKFVPHVTGTLLRSINRETLERGLAQRIFASAHYAAFVEFGTSKQRKQPYMRPAALLEVANYRAKMAAAMRKTK